MKLTKKQKTCPYCKGHKKFAVMDGYFVCQIIGNKLKFELGDTADPYEVEPFELPLGFCFACGSKLKGSMKMNLKRVKRMVPIQVGERTAYEVDRDGY